MFFFSYYNSLLHLFIAIISLFGYFSTYTYNNKGILLYLIYQYIQLINKSFIFFIFSYEIISKNYINNIIINDYKLNIETLLYLSFVVALQHYIAYNVHKFYYLLTNIRN